MNCIQKIRKEKKISQYDLAKNVGLTAPTISRYETGKRSLPVGVAKKIAATLDVNWKALYDSEETDEDNK